MNRFVSIALAAAACGLFFAASCSKPPGQAEYDRGLYELKRNNPVRARALLEKSISRRPGSDENALAYNYLGVATWKLGQYQAAQEAFEDSRRLSPTLAEPIYNLAMLHLHEGDDTHAAQLLEEAAGINENDPRPLEQLAHLYMAHQQWHMARRILHAALNRAPNSARILTALAVVDLYATSPEKSIESHLIALEKDSRYAPALFNVGLIYLTNLKDESRAHLYFKRFLAQKPTGPAADFARASLEKPAANATGPRVEEKTATPFLPPPEPVAPKTPTPAPQSTPQSEARTPAQLDDDLIQQATARAERGDASGALDLLLRAASEAGRAGRSDAQEKLLRAATKIAFEDSRSYMALGDFLMERQQADAALRAYKQAVALDAQSFDVQYAMARAATKAGEIDAALVGLTTAVRVNPHSADALWDLARLLDKQVQAPERAIESYREFEKRFPADPRTRQIADRIKALTPAARAATPKPPPAPAPQPPPTPITPPPAVTAKPVAPPLRAIEQSPQPRPIATAPSQPARPLPQLDIQQAATRNTPAATAAFNQGTQLLAQRRWDQAIAAFTRALENDDRLTSAFYNLGLAYTEAGNYEMAKAAYIRALALQPDLHSARYNLALLYFQTRDLSSSLALAQELVRQKPDFAVAHYLLGQIYSEKPDTIPEARAAYSRFLDLAPNHPATAVVRQWLASH